MKVPRGVVLAVLTVIVDEPGATTEAGLKDAVAPDGRPLTASETVPEKPPCAEIVTVYDVEPPRLTVLEVGLTETPKSGSGLTTRTAVAVWAIVPLVPEIVSG